MDEPALTAFGSGMMSHSADDPEALRAVLDLFPSCVAASVMLTEPQPPSASLLEEDLVALASPGRRNEFRAGRTSARRALALLGIVASDIGRSADRLPLWPAGALGSITHCKRICAAVAGRTTDLTSLGLDAEDIADLAPELRTIVSRRDETTALARLKGLSVDPFLLAFSAKEAFYKSYYPSQRTFLDFHDVWLDLRADSALSGEFRAQLTTAGVPGAELATRTQGRWRLTEGTILCGAFSRRA